MAMFEQIKTTYVIRFFQSAGIQEEKGSFVFGLKNKSRPQLVRHWQPDGFILQLKCPGDLVGSDVYRVPAMFWFACALGNPVLVSFPASFYQLTTQTRFSFHKIILLHNKKQPKGNQLGDRLHEVINQHAYVCTILKEGAS